MGKLIVFIFGMVIGSFLNVCIYRLPRKESLVFPGSHCTSCNRAIPWYDNVPLLSYIVLGGKCRFCRARIPFRYFLVELLTAALLTLLYAAFGPGAKFFSYSVFVCGLIAATFIDFEIQEIPDEVSIGGAVLGLVFAFAMPALFDTTSNFGALIASFAGALAGGLSIYLLGVLGSAAFRKEAMGGGDVKLMAMIGAFLGWKLVVFTFFVAPLFGAAIGIIQRIKDGREIIPYGPYLSLAAVLAIFFGEWIIELFVGGMF